VTVSTRRRKTKSKQDGEATNGGTFTETANSNDWIDPHKMVDETPSLNPITPGACDHKVSFLG